MKLTPMRWSSFLEGFSWQMHLRHKKIVDTESLDLHMYSPTTMKGLADQHLQPIPVPEPHALLPLTVFDDRYAQTTFAMGWLVDGQIDAAALEGALTRLTRKWRVLAGRIESVNKVTWSGGTKSWRLRIPIADMPQTFPTFTLTSAVSDTSLSRYVPNLDEAEQLTPFRIGGPDSAHNHLFMDPSTPLGYAAFESRVHPLTCWRLTHFPASLSNNGRSYTCIGFARCGIFDDEGASLILHALAAEMSGTSWNVPPVPNWGVNDNPLQRALDKESIKFHLPSPGDKEYSGFWPLGLVKTLLKNICWPLQRVIKGVKPTTYQLKQVLAPDVLDQTRRGLEEKGYGELPVKDSDILFAWIITVRFFLPPLSCFSDLRMTQALYANKVEILLKGTKDKKIHLNMPTSFRHLFRVPELEESLDTYPFNASAPAPGPIISYEEVCVFSVIHIARLLARWRSTFSRTLVLSAYETLQQSAGASPCNPAVDETLTLSDLTVCGFAQMDWTKIGGRATLGMARYHLTTDDSMWKNFVCILDRLQDGSILLDSVLDESRLNRLESKVMNVQLENGLQDGTAEDSRGEHERASQGQNTEAIVA